MATMHMPGYTAEASLSSVGTRYHAATQARVHAGVIRPAGFSDYLDLDTPFASIGPVFTPRPLPCLKWQCIHPPNQNPICFRTLGFWNSATHRCE